ncbi:hypothetical protein ABW20_dc0101545 [Dactylellina cionopaga]|nr:hypothetical protein ABW20_dc0101545 [Dactylellina cionopaga]
MVCLTTLPVEILAEIFTQDSLTAADITRIKRVCKFFSALARIPLSSYTFKVDAYTHPTWKFVRYLLKNPKDGEQIRKIRVEYYRRECYQGPEEWTTWWEWTPEEIGKIKEIQKRWDLSKYLVGTIIGGMNSEALLELVLCFTPNLESLDMGHVDPCVVYGLDDTKAFDKLPDHIIEFFRNGVRAEREGHEDSKELEKLTWKSIPGDIRTGSELEPSTYLWSHTLFRDDSKDKFEQLFANLRYFSHGFWEDHPPGMPINTLISIFFLPNIHTIQLSRCTVRDYVEDEIMEVRPHRVFEGFKSKVKRLKFRDSAIDRKGYIAIAKLTGMLEYLYVDHLRAGQYEIDPPGKSQLRRIFMKYNSDTLTKERCQVAPYDPDSDESGEEDSSEEDYNHDSDEEDSNDDSD